MQYDVIIVLGKSLKNGELIEASREMVKHAVKLFKDGVAMKIIFSGKWYFKLDAQPKTESQAMADYAKTVGLPDEAIVLEEESDATLANIYFSKKILEQNNWKRVVLVNFYPFAKRAMMTAEKLLGPDYQIKLEMIDYTLPEPKHSEYIKDETKKCEVMTGFYAKFAVGDDEAIYQGHLQYLKDQGFKS
jgi:uncharacterized SAM-binding protein YcdF (DUF218 family)